MIDPVKENAFLREELEHYQELCSDLQEMLTTLLRQRNNFKYRGLSVFLFDDILIYVPKGDVEKFVQSLKNMKKSIDNT